MGLRQCRSLVPTFSSSNDIPPLTPSAGNVNIIFKAECRVFLFSNAFFRSSGVWVSTASTVNGMCSFQTHNIEAFSRSEVLTKHRYSGSHNPRQGSSKCFSHTNAIKGDSLNSNPVLQTPPLSTEIWKNPMLLWWVGYNKTEPMGTYFSHFYKSW